ncbi:MAG TPA: Uma2 family endonuclease, partial [Pyrinomonadaceae bacterium]|nr:Uma2 family endonuclease [Pyrinomonadaceae bacterium]
VKFNHYRTLDSVAEYLLISQHECHVAQHVKQADGRWLLTDIRGREGRVDLASVACTLALSEVYERVSFD